MASFHAENFVLKKESTYNKSIWDIPQRAQFDSSIAKYDYLKIYEDSHGAGSLKNATLFSYTTNNLDVFLLPSESFLSVKLKLRKDDDEEDEDYNWAVDNINLVNNAFNIFEEARLYIDDVEVDKINYVGIATLVNNLLQYSTLTSKSESVKHSELWFVHDSNGDNNRKTYIRNCGGEVHLLLPLERIFPFYAQNQHVFRGVKHRVVFTLNNSNSMIIKSAAADEGKVWIESMVWLLPHIQPNPETQARIEGMLAQTGNYGMVWNAINVYRLQPPKQKEVRLALASTIHKPTHIWVGLQTLDRTTDQTKDSMKFDNLGVASSSVEINSVKFPDRDLETDFANKNAFEAYNRFLDGCENRSCLIPYDKFISDFPLLHFDISRHPDELYDTAQFPEIVVNLQFKTIPTSDYLVWTVIYNERTADLSLQRQKMKVVK